MDRIGSAVGIQGATIVPSAAGVVRDAEMGFEVKWLFWNATVAEKWNVKGW